MSSSSVAAGVSCPVCGAQIGSPATCCKILKDWSNESKMLYYFEAVKSDECNVNPEVRRFWADAIVHYLADRKRSFVFNGEEIKLAYTRRSVLSTLCLPRILSELDTTKETCKLSSLTPCVGRVEAPLAARLWRTSWYLTEAGARFSAWTVRTLVVKPVRRAWSYAIGHDGDFDDDTEMKEAEDEQIASLRASRVHVGLCEAAAELVTAYFLSRPDLERTVSLSEGGDEGAGDVQGDGGPGGQGGATAGMCSFLHVCRRAASSSPTPSASPASKILRTCSRVDGEVLATVMVRLKLAVQEGSYLKILGRGGGAGSLTAADKTVLDFRIRVNKIDRMLGAQEAQMVESKLRAAGLHSRGLSAQALVEWRRHKKLATSVEKLRGAMVNMLSIYHSIEGQHADMQVFAGLRGGNLALKQQKTAAKAMGLGGVEDVEEALREAQELIDESDELGKILSSPLMNREGPTEDIKEEELLKELEALAIAEAEGQRDVDIEKDATERRRSAKEAEAAVSYDLPDISHLSPIVEKTETVARSSSRVRVVK